MQIRKKTMHPHRSSGAWLSFFRSLTHISSNGASLGSYFAGSPTTKPLWKEYFTDPFPLSDNPIWVKDMFKNMEFPSEIMPNSKAAQLPENSGWEMLSLEEALASLERMPLTPSWENFTRILHKCRKKKNLVYAHRLYAYMCKTRLESHRSLGNYLVPMLVEAGSIHDAQHVFNRLVDRNEHSWTSLIMGYIDCEESHHAFNLYQKMQDDCIQPSGHTFVALLKACARLKDVERGQQIHSEVARKGLLERDLFIGSSLVDMYAKCGLLAKAREVFNKLPFRDAVSWNALIAAYAKHGLGVEALNSFEQMQLEGVSPNAVTFVCSLKACGILVAIDKGQEIHSLIARNGLLERHPFVGSALVDMYAKCGWLAKAHEVFGKLAVHDVVSWTALIAGYAEQGLGEKALKCFEQMQLDGICPDAVTFVCSLKACGSTGAISKGREIHAEIAKKGLETDPVIGSTLVDMYAKCGLLIKAREAFDKLPFRNEVSWNALITGYVEHGRNEEALNCLEQMQLDGISPSAVTFVCCLKACGGVGAIDKGQGMHAEIVRMGLLERDPFVGSAMVDMYVKCGSLAKAREVFDELPVRDVVSWTALITGYAKYGCGGDALDCFEQMQVEGVPPDALTLVASLKACGSIGAIDKGREIHAEISRNGLERDLLVGSALVDMYAKSGRLSEAMEVFDKLAVRDVVTWTALIAGYAHLGESANVFRMLERMREEGVKPNEVTFLSILAACNHTGLVDKGRKYFKAMSDDYGITPTIEHYNCMLDLFGRAGQLDEAVVMLKKMPFHPNLVVWHTVLGACRKWGNVELARQAFEHAVHVDEKDPAAYTLMSNIYADAHMHEDEKKVEAMRMEVQAWN